MADTTKGDPTFGRRIAFFDNHFPELEIGRYEIAVGQSISADGGPLAGSPFPPAVRSFIVTGARFTLRPSDTYKVFPPAGSLGDHSNVIPHVVLTRSTLPWERASGAGEGVPWLALLLFEEGEKPEPQIVTLGQLKRTSEYPARFPTFDLEQGQDDADKVTVIDVKASLLTYILPTGDDLRYLAHVRQGTDASGGPSGEELAVVIGNRLPAGGGISTVHLVSVEGRYRGDGSFDCQGAEGDSLVRLVSLNSWSFACLDARQSFKGLLTNVDHTPGTLRLPDNGHDAARNYFARGFVPVAHSLRDGGKTVSFYHGPLAPGSHTSDVPLPARAGDELLRFDPDIGMFDISYAAAWELGRLLALQDKQFSVSLYNWKRAHAQRVRQAEQRLLHPLPTSAAPAHDAGELPDALSSWFGDLSLLKGVPFNYLVPDERMLPEGSIRFFQLDSLWIECLLDGAFSVGRVTNSDHARDRTVSLVPTRHKVTGFLLRSEVVSGWPGLLVDATGTPEATDRKLACLRMDRLSSNVLLCLFGGEVASVAMHLKPEDLHFGVDRPDHDHQEFHKKLRDQSGQKTSAVIHPLPWRRQSERTLDINALADLLSSTDGSGNPIDGPQGPDKGVRHDPKPNTPFDAPPTRHAFTSAHFALRMLEGVDMVTFHNQP